MKVNGTLVWYYYICKREVWLIGHGIEPEQSNDFIELGRHIHEIFYQREKKEILLDNTIKIDLFRGFLKSATMQLAFYLYYLKKEKGVELTGELLIPEERRKLEVRLTEEVEEELKRAIEEIEEILKMEKPPKAEKIPYCKYCAYKELCWA